MDLRSADRRHERDPEFNQLTALLEKFIEDLRFSPSEVREAAMYACLRVEMRRGPRPIVLSPELSLYLDRNQALADEDKANTTRTEKL